MNTKHLLVFYIDEVLLGAVDHDYAYRAPGAGEQPTCRHSAGVRMTESHSMTC